MNLYVAAPGPTISANKARQMMNQKNDTASANFIPSFFQFPKRLEESARLQSHIGGSQDSSMRYQQVSEDNSKHQQLQQSKRNMILSEEATCNPTSTDEMDKVWGPFRPLPLLLSDCIVGFGWQEKYLVLRQVFSDALARRSQMGNPRLTFEEFEYILNLYPCLGKAYLRNLFSFIDSQRKGSIEETEFICGMLASAPDAPSVITKKRPELELTFHKSRSSLTASSSLTTTERETGISPITLIRLQMIFLCFDADCDGVLNLCELTHLITRLLTLLANEKRAGREKRASSRSESLLGPNFWKVVEPLSRPSCIGFKGETGRIIPREASQHNTGSFFPDGAVAAQESDMSVFFGPAKKTVGDILSLSIKKLFGTVDVGCPEKRRRKKKKSSSSSKRSKNSDSVKDELSVKSVKVNRDRRSSGIRSSSIQQKSNYEKSSHHRRSISVHSGMSTEQQKSRLQQESHYDNNEFWNYNSQPLASSRLTSTSMINERPRDLQPLSVNRPIQQSDHHQSLKITTTSSSIGSSIAAEVAASVAGMSSRGLFSFINSVVTNGGSNIFGRTCTADSNSTNGFFCGLDDVEVSNEFQVVDDYTSTGSSMEGDQTIRINRSSSSALEFDDIHGDVYGCYNNSIHSMPKYFMNESNQMSEPPANAIVHRSGPLSSHRISGQSSSLHSNENMLSNQTSMRSYDGSISEGRRMNIHRHSGLLNRGGGPSLWSHSSVNQQYLNSSPPASMDSVNKIPKTGRKTYTTEKENRRAVQHSNHQDDDYGSYHDQYYKNRTTPDDENQIQTITTTISTSVAPTTSYESVVAEEEEDIDTTTQEQYDNNSGSLLNITPDLLDYWRRLTSGDIAEELIKSYDVFGDRKRGLCFAQFIEVLIVNKYCRISLFLH